MHPRLNIDSNGGRSLLIEVLRIICLKLLHRVQVALQSPWVICVASALQPSVVHLLPSATLCMKSIVLNAQAMTHKENLIGSQHVGSGELWSNYDQTCLFLSTPELGEMKFPEAQPCWLTVCTLGVLFGLKILCLSSILGHLCSFLCPESLAEEQKTSRIVEASPCHSCIVEANSGGRFLAGARSL